MHFIELDHNYNNKMFFQIEAVNYTGSKSSEINNVENGVEENSTSCSFFNDEINSLSQAHEESLPQEQMLMVSTEKKNCTLNKEIIFAMSCKGLTIPKEQNTLISIIY